MVINTIISTLRRLKLYAVCRPAYTGSRQEWRRLKRQAVPARGRCRSVCLLLRQMCFALLQQCWRILKCQGRRKAAASADRQRIAQSVTVGIEAACPKAKNVYSTANKVLLISGASHAMAETELNIKKLPPKTAVRLRSGQAHARLMVLPKCLVCSPAAAGSLR